MEIMKTKKTIFKTVLVALSLLVVMTACGSPKSVTVPTSEIADKIIAEVAFKDEMLLLAKDVISTRYTIDDAKVAEKTIYVSGSGATAEEIAVFKAKSKEDVEYVQSILQTRLDDLVTAFENYRPDEMVKIGDAVITAQGEYVLLAVVDDPVAAQDVFEQYLK